MLSFSYNSSKTMNVELQVNLEITRVKKTKIVQKPQAFLKIKSPVLTYLPSVVWDGWTTRRSYVDWPTVDEAQKTIRLPDNLGNLVKRTPYNESDVITEHADLIRGALLAYAEAAVAHTIAQNKYLVVYGGLAPRPLHESDFAIVTGVQPQLTEEVEEVQKTFRVWFDMPELGTTNVNRRVVFTGDDGGAFVNEFGWQTVSLGSTNMNADDFAALTVDQVQTAFQDLSKMIFEAKIENAPLNRPANRPEKPTVFQLSAKKTMGLKLVTRP